MGRQHGDDLHDESNRSSYITSQQAKFQPSTTEDGVGVNRQRGFGLKAGRKGVRHWRRTLLSQASVPTICRAWRQMDMGPGSITYEPGQSHVTGATSAETHTSDLHSAAAATQQCSSRPPGPPCKP